MVKKAVVTGILFLAFIATFVGLPLANSLQLVAAETQTAQAATATTTKPSVTWGDYKYTFTNVVPSDDLDPQSTIIDDYRGLRGHDTFGSANFVHLYITIEWPTNSNIEPPASFTPLQLKLHTPRGTFWLFGKDCANDSFIWRPLVRYPAYSGGPATKIFFTFSTRGAAIDVANSYVEVIGLQQVVNMNLTDQNYSWARTHFEYQRQGRTATTNLTQPAFDLLPNFGTTQYAATPLVNIPLGEITDVTAEPIPQTG